MDYTIASNGDRIYVGDKVSIIDVPNPEAPGTVVVTSGKVVAVGGILDYIHPSLTLEGWGYPLQVKVAHLSRQVTVIERAPVRLEPGYYVERRVAPGIDAGTRQHFELYHVHGGLGAKVLNVYRIPLVGITTGEPSLVQAEQLSDEDLRALDLVPLKTVTD